MIAVKDLLDTLAEKPDSIEFSDVMEVIDKCYTYTPVEFRCGEQVNEAGTNEGSCKILGFAKLNALSESATLNLFGRFYREEVLQNPEGSDHSNIRNFMVHGWQGVAFSVEPLSPIRD